MAVAREDAIADALHRTHDELWELSERRLTDPAQVAEQLRGVSERLIAIALVLDLSADAAEGGAA